MDEAHWLFHVPTAWDLDGTRWTRILTYIQMGLLDVGENAVMKILYIYDPRTLYLIRDFAMADGTNHVSQIVRGGCDWRPLEPHSRPHPANQSGCR